MTSKEQAHYFQRLRRAFSARFAEHPEAFPFIPVLGVIGPEGVRTLEEFPAGGTEGEEWAAELVTWNRASEAQLTFCSPSPDDSDPRTSRPALETIHSVVLRAGEEPRWVHGVLRRDTTPARIDWRQKIAPPHAPALDAIQRALEDVQNAPRGSLQSDLFACARDVVIDVLVRSRGN